jgi:DNA-binding response OmpR family regulator
VEALAARATDSPAASRRAALLLGAAEGLDERDRVVVARAKEAIARRRPPEPRGTLVLSAKTRRAVLPNGREADLAQSDVGFRLLRALAESGGVVSKEDLVRKVWAVRDYHPLRDDKRLHVSILRLRERLLAEGCGELVLTAEGGYSVACPATVVD